MKNSKKLTVKERVKLRDKRMNELFNKEPFDPNPYTRAKIADNCYLRACKEFNLKPVLKH